MITGDILPQVSKVVVQEDINLYAVASGDHNPLHLDQEFAHNTHYGRVVAHGMLVLAYVSEMMTQAFGLHWVGSGRLKARFRSPVYPGDRVTTYGEIRRVVRKGGSVDLECIVGCRNDSMEDVLTGQAWITIPEGSIEDIKW